MGAHSTPLDRLTVSEWMRSRRLYRALVVDAARHREPLDRPTRAEMRREARRAAREVGQPKPSPGTSRASTEYLKEGGAVGERWLDQFLGDEAFPVTRDEVLTALRGHVLGDVVIERENPDGSTEQHVQGGLVEASRELETWETAEMFAVVSFAAANAWHKDPARWEDYLASGEANDYLKQCFAEAAQTPEFTFGVPDARLEQYPGAGAGKSGFRWPLEDGRTLAVVLWQGVMHVTESGDVAPGMGGFTATVEEAGE